MGIDNIRKFIAEKAEEFGAKTDSEFNKSYIERNNTGTEALKDNGAYFGFINSEEQNTGPYHDFSMVIFPNEEGNPWLICLGVGSSGFKNDYELATYPGLKRLFTQFTDDNGFCKSDFSDIETSLPRAFTQREELQHIKSTIKTYSKVLQACQILEDPESEQGKTIIAAFLAGYAKIREWPSNQSQRKSISDTLLPFQNAGRINDIEKIFQLIKERHFLVLQGPPGTGKTRTSKKIAEKLNAQIFFTQFHAETTFSDFIYGIRPAIGDEELKYLEQDGDFVKALKIAIANPGKNTILIIDEINRANLSNVLGPIFYLFEHKMEDSEIEIEITPNLKISQLPSNFFVIATMNTADRSLAVVDFALRRRFAWYTMKPSAIEGKKTKIEATHVLELENSQYFFLEDFTKFDEIFNWYATDSELSLQPGQAYFIAEDPKEMNNRLEYELFPLIKEYLQEGLIQNGKEEFNNYFLKRISKSLFE